MKFLKFGLRFWITITSVVSFLTGWVMLAHAPKPSPLSLRSTIAAQVPTLEPLPPLSSFDPDQGDSQNQSFFNLQPSTRSQFRPAFKTGGS
jgi:hypothetical protein